MRISEQSSSGHSVVPKLPRGVGYVILMLMSAIAWSAAVGQQPVATGTQIPVIVNIYPNSGTTPQKVADAIKEANDILKQAGLTLRVVKTNNPPGAGNGDNGDGEFTGTERPNVRTYGGKELGKLKNEKGIKISFGKLPTKEHPNNPGVAVHRDPTIIVKDRSNSQNTGQTIAHEIGHVMTLCEGHKIDATTTADAQGHAPDKPGNSGRGNAMAPSDYRTGAHLTEDQIKEMKKRRYFHGKCSTQWEAAYPATKDKQQHGGGTDERNDSECPAFPYYDLDQVFLTSLHDADTIDAQITVAAVLPDTGEFYAVYSLAFDIDSNQVTGIPYAGYYGIDRIVYIDLYGFWGTFWAKGEVLDTVAGTRDTLPDPIVATEHEFYDLDVDAEPVETSLLIRIPKAMLDLSAPEVPVVATAGSQVTICDIFAFFFDLYRWLDDPTLETGTGIPTPGADYAFAISGLEPNSPFNLFVDDSLIFHDTLDPSGSYSGVFTFPASYPADEMYFLAGQDTTGEFAYNITCPDTGFCFCGDCNGDGRITFADALHIKNYYYQTPPGSPPPVCNCDVNLDGKVNFADALYLKNWYYQTPPGSPPPCEPSKIAPLKEKPMER